MGARVDATIRMFQLYQEDEKNPDEQVLKTCSDEYLKVYNEKELALKALERNNKVEKELYQTEEEKKV